MTAPNPARGAVRFVLTTWVAGWVLIAALVVLLPLYLDELDFGVGAISAVVGAAGVGAIVSADTVGRLAQRYGAVRTIRVAVVAFSGCVLAISAVDSLLALLLLHGLAGVGIAAIRVGSQLIVRNRVGGDRRGRVHGYQGQVARLTMLIVPIAIGVLWERASSAANFAIPSAFALLLLALAGPLPADTSLRTEAPAHTAPGIELTKLLRLASGPTLLGTARAGRLLLLPLAGIALGLSPAEVGVVVGLSAGADLVTSPASGPMMDSRGRLATAVPAFVLTAGGFALLSVAQGPAILAVSAIVLGVGNGLSAGLLLTLGNDLAPSGAEGAFLGRFGALTDTGRLIGPFVVGLLGATLGLRPSAVALAVLTVVGLACLLVFVGETKGLDPLAAPE